MNWKLLIAAGAICFSGATYTDSEACQLTGGFIGYDHNGAWWISTNIGQNQSGGPIVLEVPGFPADLYGAFPEAVKFSTLRGTWERTGGNTNAYTSVGFAVDENGLPVWVAKITGRVTVLEDCDTGLVADTFLWVYAPDANPFTDAPIMDPIPFPDHLGYRLKVDLP